MSENILEINNLSKYFGGLAAVSDCSIKVKRGTITGIIGPNGSGKTTLFNLIEQSETAANPPKYLLKLLISKIFSDI